MNVNNFEEKMLKRKDIIIYVVSIIFCVVALIIASIIQFMGKDMSNRIFGINRAERVSEETQIKLEKEFENMFKNDFRGENLEVEKLDKGKEIVYKDFEKKENTSEDYNINISIPKINIKSEVVGKINSEISNKFKDKFKSIFANKNNRILYFVEYTSFTEGDILTLVVRTSIKEGSKAQQLMLDTYSYDFKNDKEINIYDEITKLNYDKDEIQKIIKDRIKEEENNSKALQELGYNVYARNSDDEKYLLDNTKCFYILNNKLYIIYAYGNQELSTTMDIIII